MAGAIISQIFSFCLATILASEDNGDLDHGDCDAFHNENGDNDKWYGTFYKENCDYDKWLGAFYNANGDDDNENGDYEKWCFLQMVMMNNEHGFTWRTLGLLLKTHGTAPDVQLEFLQIFLAVHNSSIGDLVTE